MDFAETHGSPNELGAALAAAFSKSLAKNAQDFVVSGEDTEFQGFRTARSPARSGDDTSSVDCSAGQPKPSIAVEGYFDDLPDRIVLRIKATRNEDNKILFDERVSLPLTPEMQSWESKALSTSGTPDNQEGLTWVRPDFHMPDDAASIPNMNSAWKSYTRPRCLDCGRAVYPDSAMAAKIQGVIELRVLIDSKGRPAKIIVLKGLPCGLNERAVQTVAGWKLSPATGPDGKPVVVWQDAEVTFQLF